MIKASKPLSMPCSTHHVRYFVPLGVAWRLLHRRSARKSSITRRTPSELATARLSKENDYADETSSYKSEEQSVNKRKRETEMSLSFSFLHTRIKLRRWTNTEGLVQKENQGMLFSIKSILPCIGRWHYSLSEKEVISRRKPVERRYFSFPRDIKLHYFAESKSNLTTLVWFNCFLYR